MLCSKTYLEQHGMLWNSWIAFILICLGFVRGAADYWIYLWNSSKGEEQWKELCFCVLQAG